MRAALATALVLALAVPTAAQRAEHPYLRPDAAAHGVVCDKAGDVHGDGDLTYNTAPRVDPWLVAKIASSFAVALGSYADYQESQDAIHERRAREGNGFLRSENGYVNGKRKAALTAAFIAASWWLYSRGHKRLAVAADVAAALFFGGLAVRAHQIGR